MSVIHVIPKKHRRITVSGVLIFLFCLLCAFIMAMPFFWMLCASFKLNTEILAS